MKIGKYTVEVTNADKLLFGSSGITKGDLIAYYNMNAAVIMPYVKG